jgi:ABC-type multidrug transport system ATPase subunit
MSQRGTGSFSALSNLNLKIEGAKCVGFLGPNGAGKTTILKIFTNMIRVEQGEEFRKESLTSAFQIDSYSRADWNAWESKSDSS